MKKLFLLTSLLVSALLVSAQKNTPKSYIDQFKDCAISIMHQTGVPASIVLGVAMHESGCGNSALAQHLNNQFGVKGDGHIIYYSHKKKVRTAYKQYESINDSFQDFARIMMECNEFSALSMQLTHFDYEGWAHGIQNHGYASDRKWGKRVLDIIKKYQLYLLDENPADQSQPQLAQAN
jgi:flagellum-specific peptidoglycan hydrolase FlgJ